MYSLIMNFNRSIRTKLTDIGLSHMMSYTQEVLMSEILTGISIFSTSQHFDAMVVPDQHSLTNAKS